MIHYVTQAGTDGTPAQTCWAHEKRKDAAEELAGLFELGRRRKAALRKEGRIELDLEDDGYGYCEIVECACGDIEAHCDVGVDGE